MAADGVLARIADNPKLPTPPALTLRVLEHVNRPSCSIAAIGKLISVDPAMCGRMLRLVNSSLYGLQRPVTSIERALSLLGLNHVRSLVLSLSLPALRYQGASNEKVTGYWKNSVTMAIVCRELATRLSWPDADSEMVAGLLCDFGVLLLHATFPEQVATFAAVPPERWLEKQCELEAEHIGVDHAEAGAFILKHWRLGDDLTEAIRFHHRPTEAPPALPRASTLHFASLVAQLHQGTQQTRLWSEILKLGQDQYRMASDHLLKFLESLNAKIDEFAALIDVQLGPRESFAELFARSTENLTRLAVEASLDNVRMHKEKSVVELHLQEATEALKVSEQQLWQAQKMEAIGRLAGGVAHDFNNILTVINGNCELLLEDPATFDAETRSLIQMIHRNGKRAADLTRQLLAFSRRQKFAPEVISLNSVIAGTTTMLQRLIGADVKLRTNLTDNLALVKVDPGQMEQVIMNLAVNAKDAMPDGGGLTIETMNLNVDRDFAGGEVVPGKYAVIAVRDTGHGMDDATLKKIFEPFFTTKEQGKGTGLGLAIVHGIVTQSGGHVTVSSTVGVGTVFHIYIPATSEPLTAPKAQRDDTEIIRGTETILLVEDDDSVRDFTRRVLASGGYHVLCARDGVEALEVDEAYREPIHVVISDKRMPRMNGQAFARQMTRRRPSVKIILVSGYSEDSPTDLAEPIAFLQKPFTTRQLTGLIREVLGEPAAVR